MIALLPFLFAKVAPCATLAGPPDGTILHAGPVADARDLAAALSAAKKPYSLHIFEKDGHGLPSNRALRNQLIFDWFNQHP